MITQIQSFILNPWSAIDHFGAASPSSASPSCTSETGLNSCATGLPQPGGAGGVGSSQLEDILRIVFAVLAALAVLFIVMGALRMVTSQGNPQEASKARSTIIFALVGLLVALLAEAIVAFILGKLG